MMGLFVQDYEKVGKCRMTSAFETYGWKHMYLGVPKDSPYKEEINREYLAFKFNLKILYLTTVLIILQIIVDCRLGVL
jgi:hypothetical protein